MTKHIERLMSRTSVAAMAAFAPKPEPASTIPAFAERVEETPAAGGDRERPDPIDGLTAEEQAQLEAMQPGDGPDDGGNVDHSGDAAGAGDPPGDRDDDGDDDPVAADGAAPAPGAEPRAKPKTISYGRHERDMARATKEREDLQAQLDAARGETKKERDERLRLDERTNMLLQAIQTKPTAAAPVADADPEPNLDEDPIGHALWDNRQIRKELNEIKSGRTRDAETTAAQDEERQVYNALASDIQGVISGDPIRGIAADPTMADAFVHLRETRYTELGHIFANIDINDPAQCATLSQDQQAKLKTQIESTFHNEQMLVARQSLQAKRSPAVVIRNLARARGWVPKAAEAAPAAAADAAVPTVNGAAPAARAAAAPSVKDQLSAVRENLEASRSLSDAGGSPGDQMTPQRLGDMSPREFEQYYDALKESGKLDELMGRPANM